MSILVNEWDIENIYKKTTVVGQSIPFFPTTGTYQQMVTSGTLKLFNQSLANQLNAYDMQLKKIAHWADAEDKVLWLFADIIWKGMNMQAIADLRFKTALKNNMFMQIPKASIDELTNLVSAIKTYRIKTKAEYKEQLKLAENLIRSLNRTYNLE